MKNAFVDFNIEYYKEGYEFDESAIYVHYINRLVVGNVIEVGYKNGYVDITYKTKKYKEGKSTISIEVKNIDNMYVN